MNTAADCVFCGIVAGELPATVVYEDDLVVAFLDTQPVTDGHALIVPRTHAVYLADLDDETGARMFNVARKVAAALRRSGLPCEGVNLFYADGEAAFQEIFHAHLHVFPRYSGDTFRIDADWEREVRAQELDEHGAAIRSALGR